MKRREIQHIQLTQKYDASSINSKRGMARRAKTSSNKRVRQHLRKIKYEG